MQYTQHLTEAGLTPDQASLYEALVQNGPLPASRASRIAGVSRTLSYKVLDDLEKIGLISKKDPKGGSTIFTAEHPNKLRELVEDKEEKAQRAKIAMDGVLSSIISDYNKVTGKPGVRILEGIKGVQTLYADIINEKQDILLIRSPKDESHKELEQLVFQQLKNQIKYSIQTRAITPLQKDASVKKITKYDTERLVTRKIVPIEQFNIPAQIIIYANKVAITDFSDKLMTTIIENNSITTTFRLLFEYIWSSNDTFKLEG